MKDKKVSAALESDADSTVVLRFIHLVSDSIRQFYERSPEVKLMEWHSFDRVAVAKTAGFEFAKDNVIRMIARYSNHMQNYEEVMVIKISKQYCRFRFIIAETILKISIETFNDSLKSTVNDHQF
jgi:hypothetical protein